MNPKKTPANITNMLLGIIAIEVVVLTAQAISDRQPAPDKSTGPIGRFKPQKSPSQFVLSQALNHVTNLLRWLFVREKAASSHRRARSEARGVQVFEGKHFERSTPHTDRKKDAELELRGSMQGISDKLNDPAWAGVLAANDGNISLTDAERAVPMPKSAQFVERLDRNPFVGNGMKDHKREK